MVHYNCKNIISLGSKNEKHLRGSTQATIPPLAIILTSALLILIFLITDDRYASDVHYKGGCIVANQSLWWSSYMFTLNAAPPHPGYVPDWRALWRQRLEAASEPWAHDWFSHQTQDEFWQHGSVSEDPSKMKCPILLIGEL